MERIRVDVIPLRGPEYYWTVMCDLTRNQGSFTSRDIWEVTNGVSATSVKTYLRMCAKAEHLTVLSRPEAGDNRGKVRYAVVNLNREAPPARRPNYSGDRGTRRQQLWSTIRSLDCFTVKELAVEASTDTTVVTHSSAEVYVRCLVEAGYLHTIRPATNQIGHGAVFRLKPGMNSGPKAPAVLKARFVFDRNSNKAVGVGTTEDAS